MVPDDDVPAEALASARRIAALAPGAPNKRCFEHKKRLQRLMESASSY